MFINPSDEGCIKSIRPMSHGLSSAHLGATVIIALLALLHTVAVVRLRSIPVYLHILRNMGTTDFPLS